MPYTFDAAALRRANGGRLPAESQGFTRKHNGNNNQEMHNREDAQHRLIIDQEGNIVGETVFIPRFNERGQRIGAEASLVAAVNDPRFSVSLDQGRFSVTGPEGAALRVIDARDPNVRINRETNRVTAANGNLAGIAAAEVIPAQYPRGQHYDYHAYLYLPKGSAPERGERPNVSRVLLRETGAPAAGRTGNVGEVFISEGSADLTLDYQRRMIDRLKFIQPDGHNRVTFVGFEGNNRLQTQIVGDRPAFRSQNGNLQVEFQGAPETLDIAFATRNQAGAYETTQPYRAIREGEIVAQGGQQGFADAVELNRLLPRRAPAAPQPAPKQERQIDEAPPEEISALPPGAAADVAAAGELFQRGLSEPAEVPAARRRGTHHLAI